MAVSKNRLTDRGVRALKLPGYHADGDGLYLQVSGVGGKSWIYRFTFGGTRPEIGLGSFGTVSLAEARLERDRRKVRLQKGLDPRKPVPEQGSTQPSDPNAGGLDPRQSMVASSRRIKNPKDGLTLQACWTEYVDGQAPGWRNLKTKDGWSRSINSHAAAIKLKPVATIDIDDVLLVLRPLWMTKSESAGKLRERMERVLDFAKVRGYRSGDNPAVWKGNLVHFLPTRPKLQRGHMRALPYGEMPAFMRDLASKSGMAARALEFTVLTVSRETMTLEARWEEVHGDLWSLDASRMKERAFRQPLSTGALALLQARAPTSPKKDALIFPGPAGGVMSNAAMDKVLKDMGVDATPHGMRSTFRDWAGDETEFAREVIEECLAHVVGDETERAYRRGDALRKRRAVLQAWSDYCLGVTAADLDLP